MQGQTSNDVGILVLPTFCQDPRPQREKQLPKKLASTTKHIHRPWVGCELFGDYSMKKMRTMDATVTGNTLDSSISLRELHITASMSPWEGLTYHTIGVSPHIQMTIIRQRKSNKLF